MIARGNTIIQILNGAVTNVLVDDDVKIALRNVWLKEARMTLRLSSLSCRRVSQRVAGPSLE